MTPANVMAQLKYRYDREIDRSQRPCLRRILEKDDSASKRMVLCVSSLNEVNIQIILIENKLHIISLVKSTYFHFPRIV